VRYVYRVRDGKAVRTDVQTGRRVPGRIEIVSGLEAGDQVITAGQSKPMMFDGASVAVQDPAPVPTGERAAARDTGAPQDG
jgi:membrane fusion protein (multidrug efflux system)